MTIKRRFLITSASALLTCTLASQVGEARNKNTDGARRGRVTAERALRPSNRLKVEQGLLSPTLTKKIKDFADANMHPDIKITVRKRAGDEGETPWVGDWRMVLEVEGINATYPMVGYYPERWSHFDHLTQKWIAPNEENVAFGSRAFGWTSPSYMRSFSEKYASGELADFLAWGETGALRAGGELVREALRRGPAINLTQFDTY